MLRLENLGKIYHTSSMDVEALKGLSISFRNSEFVSILGPSGCGKTTLLNIIGGLDHATSGDLYIDGISTKSFKDRDWDSYRNTRIGFVFQSYNLIPHQSVLENVELALNIGGVNKEERTRRAKEILDKVGLHDQYDKRPNQLSGGQCQRVAIARALVNDPEIVLADEPTGALDTKTSVQIMELLAEVSKDRLVLMVTHNAELAEKYSTRIVNLLDGEITGDSNPYDEKPDDIVAYEEQPKSKLSLLSAFGLSARNLRSKAKRTAMVVFAGSIGIIGVGTVLSVSSGVSGYINSLQSDMLSGNPVQVAESALDYSSLLSLMDVASQGEAITSNIEDGIVNVDGVISSLVDAANTIGGMTVTNTITQEYVDYVYAMPEEWVASIASYYGEDIGYNIYSDVTLEKYGTQTMSLGSMMDLYVSMISNSGVTNISSLASYIPSLAGGIDMLPGDEEFILGQYDLVQGSFPQDKDEIVLVLDQGGLLSDVTLTTYGYYSQEEFFNILYKALGYPGAEEPKTSFTLEELSGKTFTYYPNDTVFTANEGEETTPFTYNPYEGEWDTGMELKISGILMPKESTSYGCLSSGIYYTQELGNYMREESKSSAVIEYLGNEDSYVASFMGGTAGSYIPYYIDYCISIKDASGSVTEMDFPDTIGILGDVSVSSGGVTYTLTKRALGGGEIPSRIDIYPTDFSYKDRVTSYLDVWNGDTSIIINGISVSAAEREEITYTDNLSVVISMVGNLINIVTYALVAFTALSLLVSTVMIAIITYVSVIERVKEIGVIRSLGGRKKDVSRLFNAETFFIGLLAGLVGVAITYLFSLIINLIVGALSGIYTIASLPWYAALILIAVSVLLTGISGLVPARLAAKKDPVEALRSE